MLPTELLGTCAGKPTNWLNKNITQLSELEEDESAGQYYMRIALFSVWNRFIPARVSKSSYEYLSKC